MLLIGLSGGIGAGKSTVAEAFAAAGAIVIDSDQIAREVVAVGTSGLAEIQLRFGPDVLLSDGSLNRAYLADKIFADEKARGDLERITHPRIYRVFQERVAEAPQGSVVVHDVPLLAETGAEERYHLVVIVQADVETRLARLEARGLARELAEKRMKNQASDAERQSIADVLLNNDGAAEHVQQLVDEMMDHRFLPFAVNLSQSTAAQPGHNCKNGLTVEETFERILNRIRALSTVTKIEGNTIEIAGEADAILKLGFVNSLGGYASCDPGRLVHIRISP